MRQLSSGLLLLLFGLLQCFAQQAANPKLKVRLRTGSSLYSISGNIQLEIVRENTGSGQLIVPRWWGWGGGRTNVWVYDAQGNEVTTTFLADELPPPPAPWDFVVLNPGEFVGMSVHEPLKHFVNKPGTYEFVVEYTSYLSEKFARKAMKMPDAPFWSRERGSTLSNRIRVTVN